MLTAIYRGWCCGCALIALQVFWAHVLGFDSLGALWGVP